MPDSVIAEPQDEPKITFLDLPPEVRNMVYQFALVDEDNLTLDNRCDCLYYGCDCALKRGRLVEREIKRDLPEDRLSPNLLATNRQIKSEAQGILYGQPLHLHMCNLLLFFRLIGSNNCTLLRDIYFHDCNIPSLNLGSFSLYAARNLERLRLEVETRKRAHETYARRLLDKVAVHFSEVGMGMLTGMQEGLLETRWVQDWKYVSRTWTRFPSDL